MKRKIFILLTLLFVSFGLVSCFGDKTPKSVTVTFDVNGGNETIAAQTIDYKSLITLPNNPTREGYKFVGWYLDGESFSFSTEVKTNITLVAQWEASTEYAAIIDYGYDNILETKTVYEGAKLERPADPEREGYIFAGWYLGNSLYDFDTLITADIQLLAHWNAIEAEAVNFKGGRDLTFDLDNFRLENIVAEVTYNDESVVEIPLSREMLSDFDFNTLFLTGSFYIIVRIEGQRERIKVTLNSDLPQETHPTIIIYALKETVGEEDVYTFYSYGEGVLASMELELEVTGEVVVQQVQEGLFAYTNDQGKLKAIYSFGQNITGLNELFKVTGTKGFSLGYNVANSNIYKFVEGEVELEEVVRYYIR